MAVPIVASVDPLPALFRTVDDPLAIDGGVPVRTAAWPTYDRGDVFISDADEQAGIDAIRRRLYFRYDHRPFAETETGRFETALRDYFGTRHALGCTSGTTAIALALLGLDLPPGATVLCPAFTFAATPSAIRLAGHHPVLVECDADLNLDIADLATKLTDDVRAVVVVHMRGYASDVDAVRALTDPLGIPVIEDAVPALGARLRGRLLGTIGTAGAFSTQSDKSLNTGEGGFLVTDATDLFTRATIHCGAYEGRMARHFGLPDAAPSHLSDLDYPIFGWRLDEIRAALANSMMRRLDERVAQHQRNHAVVADGLAGVARIAPRTPVAPDALLGESIMFRVLDQSRGAGARFARALCAEGISARNIGDPVDHNVRAFWNWRFCFPDPVAAKRALPRTTAFLDQAVDIPLSANLTFDDCADVVSAIRKVAAGLPTGAP
ncbi:MAG TPA: aminotransferase class I/II-fold pyridoxal phosphate-dependent enzyme [Pseudonocardiaceae bacterium]|jgi:dTDP-4-amino-4,6-dideoxygalactose transaminase|nr:aminotransferase class I/II-fold pyridoxal phosphate-dependent enzyme [Pseudonocardiaceae bacterium]